ncbi:MAG TPA: N-acetylmuramoyl-L-alanine amidase [Iamia sp.]
MAVIIRPRSDWNPSFANGARPAPLPATDGAFLHHSDGKPRNGPQALRDLEVVGQNRFGAGISYTFAVSPDGTIWEGHSIDREGSHTFAHNKKGRAIVLIGNYESATPTAAARESVSQLLAHGVGKGWWNSTRLRGHKDVRATGCPGEVAYQGIAALVARADAILGGAVATPRLELRQGDEGEDVKFLQALLNIITPGAKLGDRKPLEGDGKYGGRTAARVKEFQRWANGMLRFAGVKSGFLDEDGVADEATVASVAFWVPTFQKD